MHFPECQPSFIFYIYKYLYSDWKVIRYLNDSVLSVCKFCLTDHHFSIFDVYKHSRIVFVTKIPSTMASTARKTHQRLVLVDTVDYEVILQLKLDLHSNQPWCLLPRAVWLIIVFNNLLKFMEIFKQLSLFQDHRLWSIRKLINRHVLTVWKPTTWKSPFENVSRLIHSKPFRTYMEKISFSCHKRLKVCSQVTKFNPSVIFEPIFFCIRSHRHSYICPFIGLNGTHFAPKFYSAIQNNNGPNASEG